MARSRYRLLGRRGERAAKRFLKRRGYKVVARNWRCRLGEIDLVAMDESMLVFVEVKTRRQDAASLPEDAITHDKKRRLRNLAQAFMTQYDLGHLRHRFDVIAVTVRPWPLPCRIAHYEAAFS